MGLSLLCGTKISLWVCVVALFCAANRVTAQSSIFIPTHTNVLVPVGGEVQVQLGVTEVRSGQPVASGSDLEFVIVSSGRFGEVIEVRQLPRAGAKDAAILRYRHNGDRSSTRDVIQYFVVDQQTKKKVTSGTVLIQVALGQLEVEGNKSVDFGNVPLGTTKETSVVIRNTGTAVAAGRAVVEEPFLVGQPAEYEVPPRATFRLKVGYRPLQLGPAKAILRFTDNPELQIRLTGNGISSLALLGTDLLWLAVEGSESELLQRSFELRTQSEAGVQVEITGGGFLEVNPSRFFLRSGVPQKVIITGKMPAAGSYSGVFVVKAGVEEMRLPWRVEVWRRAILRPSVTKLTLPTTVNSRIIKEVEFCNEGEVPWIGNFYSDLPFEVVAAPRIIMPGQSATVHIALEGETLGRMTGKLTWSNAKGDTVMLLGNVYSPTTLVAEKPSSLESQTDGRSVFHGTVVQVPQGGGYLLEGDTVHTIPPERFFSKITWRQLSPTEVLLEWDADGLNNIPPLEVRMLQLVQGDNYRVVPKWIPLDNVFVAQGESGNFFARINNLTPGVGYGFSIWTKNGLGETGQPMSAKISVRTVGGRQQTDSGLTIWVVYFVVGLATIAWFWHLKRKEPPRQEWF